MQIHPEDAKLLREIKRSSRCMMREPDVWVSFTNCLLAMNIRARLKQLRLDFSTPTIYPY